MKARYGLWLLCVIAFGCLGWYGYGYLCDTKEPFVTLIGVEEGAYYAGDLYCTLKSDKNGAVQVGLDGKDAPININRIGSGEYQFTIPTQQLADGAHALRIAFSDNTFHKNKIVIERTFRIDNIPLSASFITSDLYNSVHQGHTVHLQMQTNKKLKIARVNALSRSYSCVPETTEALIYECFIPIACEEQPNTYLFTVDLKDHVGNTVHLDKVMHVAAYPFKKQTLKISQEKVKHEQESGASEKEFEALIEKLSQQSPAEKLWRGTFCAPTEIQKVTCEFGAIRTTPHKGRYAHKAVDVINLPRSVVWAPQAGRVALKDRFAASGNTVVLDHGCGIISMVFHLAEFADINVGDFVEQGNPLGKLGDTGYATGHHLHWEMRICNIPVDPFDWIQSTF